MPSFNRGDVVTLSLDADDQIIFGYEIEITKNGDLSQLNKYF